jgi:hypothetical protein
LGINECRYPIAELIFRVCRHIPQRQSRAAKCQFAGSPKVLLGINYLKDCGSFGVLGRFAVFPKPIGPLVSEELFTIDS